MNKILGVLLVAAIAGICIAQTVDDKVVFPQWPDYKFNTYSGYLTLDGGKRNYHYAFLESQSNPDTDPLVLWLNGGPGDDGKFKADDGFGWNKNANVLFLESPAGVGFSTINDPDYKYNDANTAKDNYAALQLFFGRYKKYQGRDFWISGESYGGMYIPWLAREVINGNSDAKNIKINLKGVMIGNGRMNTDEQLTEWAQIKYLLNRNLFSYKNDYVLTNQCQRFPESYSCQQAKKVVENVLGTLNVYNIDGYCYNVDTTEEQYKTEATNFKYPYTSWLKNLGESGGAPPCSNAGPVHNYLNNADVKKALKLDAKVTFSMCNMDINQNYEVSKEGSYKILYDINKAGGRILIYSGDLDAAVSIEETLDTLEAMNLKEVEPWTAHADDQNLVQGWSVKYDILDLLVIRDAGHMVPTDQRKAAFNMFNNFITKKSVGFTSE